MENKTIKPHRTREEMFSLITSWKSSDVPQHLFCKQNKLPYNVFQYWFRKFKKEENSGESDFFEIKPNKHTFSSELEIIFPSGAKMLLSANADPAFIRSLVL